jgi:hypothetical protein
MGTSRHGGSLRHRVITLAPGMMLSCDTPPDSEILLISTSDKVRLNRHAFAILELCDGSRSRDQVVVDAMLRSAGTSRADVIAFLEAAKSRGWINESD